MSDTKCRFVSIWLLSNWYPEAMEKLTGR